MRPVYVCQLPDEMQREIRGILTRLLLYQCGTEEKAEKYFDMSLVDAVQLGMDSKIVDIDCVADSFKNGRGGAGEYKKGRGTTGRDHSSADRNGNRQSVSLSCQGTD